MRRVVWVGSSRDDLRSHPDEVQDAIGFALYQAQTGGKYRSARPLQGFGGAGILEIGKAFEGDTYRAVYALTLPGAVYVLHVFQKKAKHGRATPRQEIDLIRRRLSEAEQIHTRAMEASPGASS